MFCEDDQPVIELNRSAHRVVARYERPWIVHQHFLRHTAEGRECDLEPGKPMLLPLGPERSHMKPSRVAERCQTTNALTFAPPISTRRPKSICSWRPGGLSNRVVARASAFSDWR